MNKAEEQVTHMPSKLTVASWQILNDQLAKEENNSSQSEMAVYHMPAPAQSGLLQSL